MTFDMDIQEEYFFCHLWINLLKHWEKKSRWKLMDYKIKLSNKINKNSFVIKK